MRILAIDPGNTESGFVVIDAGTYEPINFGKIDNIELEAKMALEHQRWDQVVIEMIASYGMPVGKEVFDTCVWIGRYYQLSVTACMEPTLTSRGTVKTHHCHSGKAKDANVNQALVDRFAAGQPNHGKGTKRQPGWFYGFKADIWAAYALAVQHADTQHRPPNTPPETDRLPSGDQDDPKQALAEYDASIARLKARLAAIPPDPHRPVDTLLDGDMFPKAPTEAEWNERIKATRRGEPR